MEKIEFEISGISELQALLSKPVERISICLRDRGEPTVATIWHSSAQALRVVSNMLDIDERKEVGFLAFEEVHVEVDCARIETVNVNLGEVESVKKLVLRDDELSVDAGVRIRFRNGRILEILAGVSPYSLAISGFLSMPHIFEPAYDIDEYLEYSI